MDGYNSLIESPPSDTISALNRFLFGWIESYQSDRYLCHIICLRTVSTELLRRFFGWIRFSEFSPHPKLSKLSIGQWDAENDIGWKRFLHHRIVSIIRHLLSLQNHFQEAALLTALDGYDSCIESNRTHPTPSICLAFLKLKNESWGWCFN